MFNGKSIMERTREDMKPITPISLDNDRCCNVMLEHFGRNLLQLTSVSSGSLRMLTEIKQKLTNFR